MQLFVPIWRNEVFIRDGVGILRLTHPDGHTGEHMFDVELIDIVRMCHWSENRPHPRAYAKYKGKFTALHQLYFPREERGGKHVDHINHDSRDSRRANLRLVTNRQNSHNRIDQSIYGPNITREYNRRGEPSAYRVKVKYRNRQIFGPRFQTLEEAQECRERYIEIAWALDAGLRDEPTKPELRAIAAEIRGKLEL